ncbi:MAG: DUF2178 domain-containing protein [Thermoplasmata archaeon]
MEYKNYRLYKVLIGAALGAITVVSVSLGNYIVPILAFIAGVAGLYLLSKKSNALLTDERIDKLAGMAARVSYTVTAIATALLGMIFIAIGKDYPDFLLAGNILAGVSCGSILIYAVSFKYFNKKADRGSR